MTRSVPVEPAPLQLARIELRFRRVIDRPSARLPLHDEPRVHVEPRGGVVGVLVADASIMNSSSSTCGKPTATRTSSGSSKNRASTLPRG